MASSTLPVTIRGRFVNRVAKEWNAFTADDGKEVKAGRSEVINVLDQADNLRAIRCNGIAGLDQLGFGIEVVADCEARPYRGDLVFTAISVQRAAVKAA